VSGRFGSRDFNIPRLDLFAFHFRRIAIVVFEKLLPSSEIVFDRTSAPTKGKGDQLGWIIITFEWLSIYLLLSFGPVMPAVAQKIAPECAKVLLLSGGKR
jgi:hypothetical protein